MKIEIRLIKPEQARYKTCGDYFYEGDTLVFQIVEQKTDFETKMILIHEMIEQALTEEKGTREEEISAFDLEFIAKNKDSEPGDDPKAPYYNEHQIATMVERMMCLEAGIIFEQYNDRIIF